MDEDELFYIYDNYMFWVDPLPETLSTAGASRQTCAICMDNVSVSRKNYQCPECDTLCCKYCFTNYLTHKITNGEVSAKQFVCPGATCSRPLPNHQLHSYLSATMVQKYFSFLKDYQARQSGHTFCPNPHCGKPLKIQNKFRRRVHCSHCNHTSCRKCGDEYHRWSRCEKKYRTWCTVNNTQRCPNCDSMIEKNQGCRHMTCTRCRYQFCWFCRGEWSDHNDFICYPMMCIRSQHRWFGPAPLHIITKPVAAVVGASAVVVGGSLALGVVVTAAPPVLIYLGASYAWKYLFDD